MTTLRDFQKHVHIYIDKYNGRFLVMDKRHMKKLPGEKQEIVAKHTLDLTDEYKAMDNVLHEYVVTLETMAVDLIRELYKERGLTPTDQEIINRLNKGGMGKYQRLIKI